MFNKKKVKELATRVRDTEKLLDETNKRVDVLENPKLYYIGQLYGTEVICAAERVKRYRLTYKEEYELGEFYMMDWEYTLTSIDGKEEQSKMYESKMNPALISSPAFK